MAAEYNDATLKILIDKFNAKHPIVDNFALKCGRDYIWRPPCSLGL